MSNTKIVATSVEFGNSPSSSTSIPNNQINIDKECHPNDNIWSAFCLHNGMELRSANNISSFAEVVGAANVDALCDLLLFEIWRRSTGNTRSIVEMIAIEYEAGMKIKAKKEL